MKIVNYMSAAIVCGLLLGCGSDESAEKPGGVIPQHQLDALEKAKGVEAMMLEADEERRKAREEKGI